MFLSASLVLVIIIGSSMLFGTIGSVTQPFVAWSFDKYNGTRLIPDYNEDPRFQGDFSRLGTNASEVLQPGMEGSAIYVPGKKFAIASNINRKDCIHNPGVCENGLTLTFWLKLENWNGNDLQVIFMTTTSSKSLPGVYFGKGESEHLYFMIRLESGAVYETQFSHEFVWRTWSHLGLTWSKDAGTLLVYVNGSLLNDTTTTREAGSSYAGLTDLTMGNSVGPTFVLDEFHVYYDLLSAEEVALVYFQPTTPSAPGVTITATATITTTATTKLPLNHFTTDDGEEKHIPVYVYAIAIIVPVLALVVLVIFCLCRQHRSENETPRRSESAIQMRPYDGYAYKASAMDSDGTGVETPPIMHSDDEPDGDGPLIYN